MLERIAHRARESEIRWVAGQAEHFCDDILDLIRDTDGVLDFNDALLVVLCRAETIDNVASFDRDFDIVPDFHRIS